VILAKANADSQRLLEEVRASGDRLAEQKRQEAIAAAEQIALKAQESIALERDKIMAEMKHELGRLVVDTTARVTGKVLSPDDHQRINEETARQIAA
jgi:F-type H+-transporting ATPase subunit b